MAKTENMFSSTHLPPLADRIRPATIDEFIGQNHLVDDGGQTNLEAGSSTILFIDENYFPENVHETFYKPTHLGYEEFISNQLKKCWPNHYK